MKVFDSVPIKKPAANVFNLSHDVKSSYNFDKIYPFFCELVNPGETFNVSAEVFMRAMPMLAPVMHNVDMYIYFVATPLRLVWNERKKYDFRTFITGGEKGNFGQYGYSDDPSGDYIMPHFRYSQFRSLSSENRALCLPGGLLDHLGYQPIKGVQDRWISTDRTEPFTSLPLRVYQFVWNELFRNQNVQNEVDFSYDTGLESPSTLVKLLTMRKKCWEKDYFTSCLPFQQRGETVTLPISSSQSVSASMTGTGSTVIDMAKYTGQQTAQNLTIGATSNGYAPIRAAVSGGTPSVGTEVELSGTGDIALNGTITFTGLSIGTISDFRYCLRLQQWLENNARCGSRYIEQILAHFGVRSSDARLQRPELLGGGKIPLIFSDVPQTSADTLLPDSVNQSVQGNLAGKGTLYGKTTGFKKYFEEHCIVMGLLTIVPRTSYCQGIKRQWSLMDKTDFYFPEFAHLSEQAVLNKEVYYDPSAADDEDESLNPDGVFGYQGRFTEYRYIPSTVHGELRNTLTAWHLGRIFGSLPRLNSDFVEAHSRVNIFAAEDISESDYDPFVAQIHVNCKAVRPMPKFAVPTL